MGPATGCPSRKLGFCDVEDKCYAKKAERLYPHVLPYRIRQYKYWTETSAKTMINDFEKLLKRIRVKINYLRFNEAGDFFKQNDVEKLNVVSEFLMGHGITTYGYTARQDLNFNNCSFLIKGSNHNNANNGMTVVVPKNKITEYLNVLSKQEHKDWVVCPMSCKVCDICKESNGLNVIFPLH